MEREVFRGCISCWKLVALWLMMGGALLVEVMGVSGAMVGVVVELVGVSVLVILGVVGPLVRVLLSNVSIICHITVFTPRDSSQDLIKSNIHFKLRSFHHIFYDDFPDSLVWVRFQMFLVFHDASSSLV